MTHDMFYKLLLCTSHAIKPILKIQQEIEVNTESMENPLIIQ